MMPAHDSDAPTIRHTVRLYEEGWSVERVLTQSLGLEAREVRRLGQGRRITLNRAFARLRDRVGHADHLLVRLDQADPPPVEPVRVPFRVVHEDGALVVIDKPPFLLVHPTEPGQRHTLINGIAHRDGALGIRAGIHPVHRLDRDTSGLLVVARSAAAHRILAEQLRARTLRREYIAVVDGVLREPEGMVDAPIGRHPSQGALRAVRPDGEPARTEYQSVAVLEGASLVHLKLETGRTHQIRVHMAHLGHPLLGDPRYGRRGTRRIGRQALHAARLSCHHPLSHEPVAWEAPLPDDMRRLLDELGGDDWRAALAGSGWG